MALPGSGDVARWMPYVPIPKALGSLLGGTQVADPSTAAHLDPATPTMALLDASQNAALVIQTTIKRITATCRQLLLGVLDLSEVTDEHVSLLYTAVVKEFFNTITVFEKHRIDVTDLQTFPEDLRASLEDLFEVTGTTAHSATPSRPGTPTEVASHRRDSGQSASTTAATYGSAPADDEGASEEITMLIHQLIRSLQDKHRSFLASLDRSGGASATGPVLSTTSSTGSLPPGTAPPSRRAARRPRPMSAALATRLAARMGPVIFSSSSGTSIHSADDPRLVAKLYLQVDRDVKRASLDPPVDAASLTPTAIYALFIRKFHLVLPPPPDTNGDGGFPYRVEVQDAVAPTRPWFELEDAARDITDGSLLRLVDPLADEPRRPQARGGSSTLTARERVAAIGAMRQELADLRSEVADHTAQFARAADAARDAVRLALTARSASAASASTTAPVLSEGLSREAIAASQPALEASTMALDARATDLWEHIEQLRLDMVQRSAVPTKAALEYARAESTAVAEQAGQAAASIDAATPAWKRVWERELGRVVVEQQALARAEAAVDTALDVCDRADRIAEQMRRVAELAGSRTTLPRPVVVDTVDPDAPDGTWEVTVQGLMAEISATPVDHDARMRAVERTERVRAWTKENSATTTEESDFALELREAAAERDAKEDERLSAFERLELERERKNRAVLAALREASVALQGQRALDIGPAVAAEDV
ncbi:actin interacting protein 3-domain-containing protein [Blastocladiella britannica]|nr:actin interacting protein 3-domain-containing protein [Blastocladiella britannica]